MKKYIKKLTATLFLTGSIASVHATVCNIVPGSVTCGHGTVDNLSGNGMAIAMRSQFCLMVLSSMDANIGSCQQLRVS